MQAQELMLQVLVVVVVVFQLLAERQQNLVDISIIL
tara:strand:+ start:435 stop:542 length:108 start_codon:yes stop_codon:yes gene_type:complete